MRTTGLLVLLCIPVVASLGCRSVAVEQPNVEIRVFHASGRSPADVARDDALILAFEHEPLPRLQRTPRTVAELVEEIDKVLPVKVQASWGTFEDEEIKSEELHPASYEHMSAGRAIRLALANVPAPDDVWFEINDGCITLFSDEYSDAPTTETRVYDIEPLLKQVARQYADPGEPPPSTCESGCCPPRYQVPFDPVEKAMNELTCVIPSCTTPDDWVQNGGTVACMESVGTRLVICHHTEGHIRVELLLRALAKSFNQPQD